MTRMASLHVFQVCLIFGIIAAFLIIHKDHNAAQAFSSIVTRTSRYESKIYNKYKFNMAVVGGVTTTAEGEAIAERCPQVFSNGYSDDPDLTVAILKATESALARLPSRASSKSNAKTMIDFGMVFVSSLYDASASVVVPTVLATVQGDFEAGYVDGIKCLIGCSAAGVIGSHRNANSGGGADGTDIDGENECAIPAIKTIENENTHGVTVTLALLPDIEVSTFHVEANDVPDDFCTTDDFKGSLGLLNWKPSTFHLQEDVDEEDSDTINEANFLLLASPGFQTKMSDFLMNLETHFPDSNVFGGLASTVSSLTRARLFRYDESRASDEGSGITQILSSGCVGIIASGDIQMRTMICQGTKPVGATYRVAAGEGSTIRSIVLDESSPVVESFDPNYINKASIPKPVLAEANFLMKTLSDDDQSFMSKALLIGIEQGGPMGRSPSELERLAKGKGHQYSVYQVASAGMKDGSVTMPLGALDVQPGSRIKFFVRDGEVSKKEIKSILKGYSMKVLEEAFITDGRKTFYPTGCLMFPTLDRGTRVFGGRPGYESQQVSEAIPALQSLSGLFCNGIIGKLNGIFQETLTSDEKAMVHGSASGYALFGSKLKRPLYDASAEANKDDAKDAPTSIAVTEECAPRQPNGELVVRRREIQSGRLMTVSTVQWSVAEKLAVPTSMFEGYMWDKETEVDRLRERVPLVNLLSQVKLSMSNPEAHSPRDWTKTLESNSFAIIGEVKRSEPTTGSLRQRYSASSISDSYVQGGATALSVNCDKCFFGGSIDDITQVRTACPNVPILASDLLLYPYQLYKFYLAGADAVTIIAAALEDKDLLYLAKIAKTLKMQTVLTVTSEVQLDCVTRLPQGSVDCVVVSNRDLEDFSFDMTGNQALSLLKSSAMESFREKHDVPVLVEGRIGIIGSNADDIRGKSYLASISGAGANGVIVGQGLAQFNDEDPVESMQALIQYASYCEIPLDKD